MAGLAGLLVPRLALQAVAAPFQAQEQQQAIRQQILTQQAAIAQRDYGQRVDAAKGALDATQRHDATLEQIASRQFVGDQNRKDRDFRASQAEQGRLLGDLHDAGDNVPKLQAALSALDGGGFGHLVPAATRAQLLGAAQQSTDDRTKAAAQAKDEGEVQKYLAKANDPQAVPAARAMNARMAQALIARNDPDDPRVAAIDGALPSLGQNSQLQDDRHLTAAATAGHLDALTATENATRAGKVQSLIDAHDYSGLRQAATQAQTELTQTRTKWIAPEQAARISAQEAAAAASRARAVSTAAGLQGQGRGTNPLALQRADVSFGDAIAKTQKEVDSLGLQLSAAQAMQAMPGAADHSADVDRLNALVLARQSDLSHLQAYRTQNQARLNALGGGLPPVGPLTIPPGATTSDGRPVMPTGQIGATQPPSGWTIRKRGG